MEEVRYHMLRPSQIVKRRKDAPIAYIPIGTIEWHGVHNPVGADGLQAEGLAILCAERGGGLVFPTLYYGENRLEALVDVSSSKGRICRKMGLSTENFDPEKQPFSALEQALNYHKMLIHILAEVETLGFELGIFIVGHYPLIDCAKAAIHHFNKREHSRKRGMLAWAAADYLLVENMFENAGDHGAKWETSHLMHLHPETVNVKELPPVGGQDIGIKGDDPRTATAAFGRETLEKTADIIVKEAQHRLDKPNYYKRHGRAFEHGVWKKTEEKRESK